MDRIKARIALLVAAAAVSAVFFAAPPARAADNCHPLPDAVCNSHQYVVECVIWRIWYGWTPEYCRT